MRLSPFDACVLYLAIKSHFEGNYNFFKYQGKVKFTQDQFDKRNDRFMFARLTKLVDGKEMRDFLVAQILNGRLWVGEFLNKEAMEDYHEYLKRKQNFEYMFRQEVGYLFASVENPRELFEMGGSYPPILMAAFSGTLSIQYFSILMKYFDFGPKFDSLLNDDYLWPTYKRKAEKLLPFLEFDDLIVRKIIKENLNIEKSS